MPTKIKPSTKEYIRDRNNRMTNKFQWKHYTVSNTSTDELKKLYESPSYRRKKGVIKRELEKKRYILIILSSYILISRNPIYTIR